MAAIQATMAGQIDRMRSTTAIYPIICIMLNECRSESPERFKASKLKKYNTTNT